MRLKHLAAAGMLALVAAFLTLPAFGAAPPTPICANCHEQQHQSIFFTAHGFKNDANGTMCQACHGDATAHLQDPVKNKPANLIKRGTPAEKTAICMNCHSTNRHLAFWESGKHSLNDITCANCHNIHGKQGNPSIAPFTTTFRPNESELCGTCHRQIRAATLKPSHHPIVEGKIKCSDCHNPHGAISPVMLRNATVNEQCVSCHTDKRGPFVFEHPPVEENCATCHNPHGSSHAKLLVEHPPNLCQDCHDAARHPGTIYGAAGGFQVPGSNTFNTAVNTRLIARGCPNCHNAVHGSNAPGNRGKFFLR